MLLHFVTYIETFVIFITPGMYIYIFMKSFKRRCLKQPLIAIALIE